MSVLENPLHFGSTPDDSDKVTDDERHQVVEFADESWWTRKDSSLRPMDWVACFDLLQAPISYDFKREEMIQLVETNGQTTLKLEHTFGTMWTLVATNK